eukprot:4631767-Prymnesium_polylepis.2
MVRVGVWGRRVLLKRGLPHRRGAVLGWVAALAVDERIETEGARVGVDARLVARRREAVDRVEALDEVAEGVEAVCAASKPPVDSDWRAKPGPIDSAARATRAGRFGHERNKRPRLVSRRWEGRVVALALDDECVGQHAVRQRLEQELLVVARGRHEADGELRHLRVAKIE